MGEVSGGERRGERADIRVEDKHLTAVQEPQKTNASLAWLQAKVRGRSTPLHIRTTDAMLSRWREGGSPETAHIRELAGLPGTGHQHGLPIDSHAHTIRNATETKPICAVRSPPGSGKTMILPELLHEWAAQGPPEGPPRDRKRLPPAVMIVFPTQYGCLKIRDSMRELG